MFVPTQEQMLPSPPLAAALSKTAAAATRRVATAAASVAAHRLLLPVRSLTHNPSAPGSLIPRRRFGHMPQEERTASLAPLGRHFAVAVADGGVDGEAPALVVVSFYRFADFPDHATFRRPLKELCEELVVIDVRNMYEIRIGKFKRAVDPCTNSFREFPTWVDDQFELVESDTRESGVNNDNGIGQPAEALNASKSKQLPRVAMYCTGGIRCEKASSFLLSKGFKEVYHLEGGILKYLEEVPKAESLWEGECFVFDKRVSVEHGLAQGTHRLCYGCKQPVSDEDMESPEWEYGVSCPYCFATKSEEEKERARARQWQFETWGVIGGPDKGRSPKRHDAKDAAEAKHSCPAQSKIELCS
ncbi:hypothetical protein PVAP13_3NG151100 [Panicum virgatum]|uniref:Rhodanese domain-containing protein n=1 Tax=Panicum virgatum TaxID=38727 RepID=A0A8T0UI12_PANVG|nr:hypothetical protein PVAP13_3NG151100 [Panicum virgatum]